jgi:putative hydrolase
MSAPQQPERVHDFHTHTFYSDGVLSPMEQARRAAVAGYVVIGMTDHMGLGGVGALLATLRNDRDVIERYWDLRVIVGVELTHVPAEAIAEAAEHARSLGAEIIVVHGETPVEPVPAGTNRAAIESGFVDILAHPGMLTLEDARRAAELDVFLEISARRGHSLTNGHVVRVAREAGARLIVNSDAHEPSDLLSPTFQARVARGAGVDESDLTAVLSDHPRILLERVLQRR